ncbi:hypothetical protein [Polyangium aurulentum]|uniref:hypothetical protein n=1 Tax=Polyangium aurulentum TaxID=2567896 RepID=UPI00197F3DF8|nr:hypothetical protein [Polyangium aurulentum]UQA59297.1 hypothetical protein E8A73_001945 [Polyangium aurulentum]
MNPTHGGPGGPPWPGAPQDPAQAPQQAYPQQQQGWPQQQQPQQGWPQQQQGWPQQQQPQQGWPQQQQQGWPQQQQGWPQQQQPQQGWQQQQAGNPYAPPMGIQNTPTNLSGHEGFKHPRLAGLGIFACGLLLGGINAYEIESAGKFYIKALVFTPMALLLGLWLMIAGQPRDEHTGEIALWGKIGAGVTSGAGLVLGVLACVLVGC